MGVFPDSGILSILEWGLIVTLFMGGVVMPIEGHGLFGVKEDSWFPFDLLMTCILWAAIFWMILNLWPGAV
jgi:nitric oxide reductase large subunit